MSWTGNHPLRHHDKVTVRQALPVGACRRCIAWTRAHLSISYVIDGRSCPGCGISFYLKDVDKALEENFRARIRVKVKPHCRAPNLCSCSTPSASPYARTWSFY